MKMKKWLISALMIGTVLLGACSDNSNNDEDSAANNGEATAETIKVGTLSFIEHESLNAAEEGFYEALADNGYVEGENLEIQRLSAQGTQANINPMAEQIAENNDLVLSLGTDTTQALANVEQEKPIIFTAVTDPVAAGLVDSQEEPGRNITGTSDHMPVDKQIQLLLSLDENAETVGIIYNSSESNSEIQAQEAVEAIEAAGLEAVVTTVTSTNDVQQNLESIAGNIDLLYSPTDNTIAGTMATVKEVLLEHKIPSVLGSPEMVADGGLTTYSINYKSLGYQAGELAIKILKDGADPATTPYENADNLELIVNEEVAEELGINPDSIQSPE